MNAVTLGDFLQEAGTRFEQAATGRGGLGTAGAVAELRRISLTMLRYLDVCQTTPTASRLASAFALAANRYEEAGSALDGQQTRYPGPRLRALSRSADLLQAGADLLCTHQASTADGYITDRSDWAGLLRTPTISDALTDEVSHWADRIALACDLLARNPATVGSPVPGHLGAVARALRKATSRPPESPEIGNGRVTGWELLYAIPAALPPPRLAPGTAKSAEQLSDRVAVSAVRLKAAAFAMPDLAAWPEGASSHSWRMAAHTAMIALEAARLAADAADHPDLAAARTVATALDVAQTAWEQVGEAWDAFETDSPQDVLSPASVEMGELALSLCRLILNDPQWKPRRGEALDRETIPPMSDRERFPLVLSAIHQASDAIARMGSADIDTIRRFTSAGRLYMSNRILGDPRYGMRAFITAPSGRAELLLQAYQAAVKNTVQAVDALDELVVGHDAPSRALAMARKVIALEGPVGPRTDVDAADVTGRLTYLRRPMGSFGPRSEQLDREAIISAYRDEGLTLRECADRFATSPYAIRTILLDSDVPIRASGPRSRPDASATATPSRLADSYGPIESELRARGVDNPSEIAKARELDQAIARQRLNVVTLEANANSSVHSALRPALQNRYRPDLRQAKGQRP